MTREQWESLCDNCGRCCLHKIEYEDTERIHFTNVACRLLDPDSCQCTAYAARKKIIPDCVTLSPENLASLDYMPSTCAYKLVAAGKKLPAWHPLISHNPECIHEAGISVRGRTIPETGVADDDLEEYLVDWIEADQSYSETD